MDNASEAIVKQRLADYLAEKTMIVVTHKTPLLDLVDRIVVLDKGQLMADGGKEGVMKALREGRGGKAL